MTYNLHANLKGLFDTELYGARLDRVIQSMGDSLTIDWKDLDPETKEALRNNYIDVKYGQTNIDDVATSIFNTHKKTCSAVFLLICQFISFIF